MQVITLESEAFQKLINKISDIEQYVKRASDLFIELESTLELSSRELMDTLQVSKSTIYRWRRDRIIPFRYDEKGNALYSYRGLILAIKNGDLYIPKTSKAFLLSKLTEYKESLIINSLLRNDKKEILE
ncbi:hypothetical protein SDC9_205174 [bioreactor metagenome]|uniref:Helix-turn-helix domain-containing protein n=1 Tax=bioreactor metagenome TaxID=1076179 RepID=A0A645J2W4_9ZZZZ